MFRLVDLIELDFGQGLQKKIYRVELFEACDTPNRFSARLWEIQSLSIEASAGTRFTGEMNTTDQSLAHKSNLLPAKYTSPFSSESRQTAIEEVVREFNALLAATDA